MVCSFPGKAEGVKIAGVSGGAAPAAAPAAKAAAADDDDDDSDDEDLDLFGELTPEEQAAADEKKRVASFLCFEFCIASSYLFSPHDGVYILMCL